MDIENNLSHPSDDNLHCFQLFTLTLCFKKLFLVISTTFTIYMLIIPKILPSLQTFHLNSIIFLSQLPSQYSLQCQETDVSRVTRQQSVS